MPESNCARVRVVISACWRAWGSIGLVSFGVWEQFVEVQAMEKGMGAEGHLS